MSDEKRDELLSSVEGAASMDVGQDNVSRIIGKVVAHVDGKKYIVGPVGFDLWSAIQNILLEGKRERILMTVRALRGKVPDAEYRLMWREAMSQVGNTSTLGAEDADYLLATPEGMGTVLWVLIEAEYKADVTRPNLEKCRAHALDDDTMDKANQLILGRQLFSCMGIEMAEETAGNESGPTDPGEAASQSQD